MREKAKLEEEKRKKEEAALLKPVQTQKVPFGVDPKTVLCAFYKAGTCEKGSKCKFSHDMNVGRKVEKKNLYEDSREDKMKGECRSSAPRVAYETEGVLEDTMDSWDEEKLRTVVLSKGGNPRTTTDVSRSYCLSSLTYRYSRSHPDCMQILHPGHRDGKVRISAFLSYSLF